MGVQQEILKTAGGIAAAVGATAGAKEDAEKEAEALAIRKKKEAQADLEHAKKIELQEAKQKEIADEAKRKDALLEAKLKESSIKQEGMKTQQGQEAELRRLKIGEQRNKLLTSKEKFEFMRAKAKDSLEAARDSKRKGAKAFNISDRLSSLQKKRR